ncbi:MAG: hypothetical protein AAFN91_10900, partial [Pseudomonadota bacterium]
MTRISAPLIAVLFAMTNEFAHAQNYEQAIAEEHQDKFLKLVDSLVYCQDKSINAPAVNQSTFTSVHFKTVCVPDSFGPVYEDGIEAGCEVRYKIRADGVPEVQDSVCSTAFHSDFVSVENEPRKLRFAKVLYEAVSRKAVSDSRFAISNEFEAETLGTLVQAYEFFYARDGGQR